MTTPPLTPEEYEQAADATPPLGLPTTVDYHHLIALVTALLPTFDPIRVSAMRIDHRAITVWYWDGQRVATHKMPITHVQGSATEGGHPTTPPIGLRGHDGGDTQ